MSDENNNQTDKENETLKKQVEAQNESIKRLEAKNQELLEEKKAEKAKREAAQEEAAKAAEAQAEKAGDVEKLKDQLEARYKKQISDLETKLETANGTVHKLVVDNGLTSALQQANVAAQFSDAAKALIKTSNEITVEGDKATIGGISLDDFVKEWSSSDQGKHFVAAPANGGAGASGSHSGSSFNGDNPFKKGEHWNMTEQARIKRENPELAKRLSAEA